MSESLYAVYEITNNGEQLAGLFPPTDGGCRRAIEWGEEQYDIFHAADPGSRRNREAFLAKCHGVHIDRGDKDESNKQYFIETSDGGVLYGPDCPAEYRGLIDAKSKYNDEQIQQAKDQLESGNTKRENGLFGRVGSFLRGVLK